MSTVENPLISIIVPVFNVERYIDACLVSIRQQTYQNLEIIVVEDCSTDNSLKALEPHLADKRIRLIQHAQNGGLSAARNTGIEAATGEYLMFVDSDDVVELSLVEVCFRATQMLNADVITYDCIPFGDDEPIKPAVVDVEQLAKSGERSGCEYFELPHFTWLKFVRAELFKDSGLRFPVGLCYEDWPIHWWLGFTASSIYRIEAGLYHYRQRGTSITGSTGSKLLDLYRVQAIVIAMVGEAADTGIRTALGNKLHDSYWSILTRIDERLLVKAFGEAKLGVQEIRNKALVPAYNFRRCLITILLRLPVSVGLPALRTLRALLILLSPARRNQQVAGSLTKPAK